MTEKRLREILLITSLLSIGLFTCQAQEYKALKIMGTMVTWSILNGIGDGLNDSGHKDWGHAVNALSYATLIGGTVWSQPERKDLLKYLTIAAGIRYVTFDASYNITRNLPISYIGTTATTDKLQTKVSPEIRTLAKGIVGCLTIVYTFNTYGNKKIYPRNKTFK